MGSAADVVWIDVSMWSGLTGKLQPSPISSVTRRGGPDRRRQLAGLGARATGAHRRAGRLATWPLSLPVEQRDPSGRPLDAYAHGIWEWVV